MRQSLNNHVSATLFLLALLIGGLFWPAGSDAQIMLTPPGFATQTQPAQASPPQGGSGTGEAENGGASQAQPHAEAPRPAPPDFSIVDRATGVETAPLLEAWARRLDEITQLLNAAYVSYGLLNDARSRLEITRNEIDDFMRRLTPKIAEARAQVDNLGPVPESGDPEPVALQRGELQRIFGTLTAIGNVADSARLRSTQLTNRIQDIRRAKFTERVFERVPETYSLSAWQSVAGQFNFAVEKARQTISGWWEHMDRRADAVQLLILGALIAAAAFIVSARGVRHFRRWKEPDEPPYWRRATSAAWVTLLRLLPYAVSSTFLFYSFRYQELMPQNVELLAYSAMRSLLIVTAVCALVATTLAPKRPHWRLLPMDDRAAIRIRWLVVALGAAYSLTLFLDTVRDVANAPFTLTIAQSLVSSILIAAIVIAILLTPRNAPKVRDDTPEFKWLRKVYWPLWGVALIILLTALAGYIGLARFIASQLIVTGTIVSIFYLVVAWVDAVAESMSDEGTLLGGWLKAQAGLDQRRREQISLPVTLLLKLCAVLIAMPLILLQWGFDWKDISDWGSSLLFGFQIGQMRISLAAIFAALAVFATGYVLARVFQGWLDRRVLETAGISGGARHSIRTAVGYMGVVAAALIAISYAGLDLSNVALVAGALSVGIGLGLQGVVNNFVSGLILLAERPIKVGDWVVVGDEQGIIKKISVRATEIETFDRANVLIPNSYFISEKVKNWTLHNYSGRISIVVGVHYDSDPRQVKEILLRVARANSRVMPTPEPFVYFGEFGSDALEFTLYAYAYDITKSLTLRSDLRIEIVEAFRAAGIEIPYRQTDLNFRDDWFKEALMRSLPAASQERPKPRPRRRRRRIKSLKPEELTPSGKNGGGAGRPSGGTH